MYSSGDILIHKMQSGTLQLINEKTMMGILFDGCEWSCPYNNWCLFLNNQWVGFIDGPPEDDEFMEKLQDKRMESLNQAASSVPQNCEERKPEGVESDEV